MQSIRIISSVDMQILQSTCSEGSEGSALNHSNNSSSTSDRMTMGVKNMKWKQMLYSSFSFYADTDSECWWKNNLVLICLWCDYVHVWRIHENQNGRGMGERRQKPRSLVSQQTSTPNARWIMRQLNWWGKRLLRCRRRNISVL